MGLMRNAGVWLGLVAEEDDRSYGERGHDAPGYSEDDFDDEELDAPAASAVRTRIAERVTADRRARPTVSPITRPTPISTYQSRGNLAEQPQLRERPIEVPEEPRRYQITTLHPTTYNEARTIGEHFRDNVPVIMNLTEMDESDAKRLVDFAAGLAFGLRGTIERVTNRVFLLSPANVTVTAEDKARIAEGGFFNQS